ncbi:MAG: hypothetical protein BM564_11445 [Bacteroidetes bacterium MedPE-SWsnd-G2]|nr:MAG: hypothetical protein BM564_11445 [Bacteroidetes bacterium MedPE-SWsnd-G2]
MKQFKFFLPIALLAFTLSTQAQEIPPLMKQINNGNWFEQSEAEQLVDELYMHRALQAYFEMIPAMNTIGLRDGSEAVFGAGYNVLPIWKDRMDSRAWVPTPNADVIYSMSYLDLKETGPLVVAAPPKVIGMFTDFFQRTLTDVGYSGPDQGKGGLYLLLPPNYDGPIPAGYHTFESSTYNVFLFFRTLFKQGENGPDTSEAVATAEDTRVYKLWDEEKNIPAMEFPNASGKRINMMYETDFTFWTKMKEFVDYEPYSAIPANTRGVLASLGIIKGKPFNPTPKQVELLNAAVKKAPELVLAKRQLGREDKRNLYYNDRQYERVWSAATAEFYQDGYLDVTQRAAFMQMAYSSAPAMVKRVLNGGAKYPVTPKDADGVHLNGSHQYKLHLPAGIPARLFWAVTAYNVTDGTMPETDQLMPSINQYNDYKKNKDGSVDLYFGPTKPKGVPESNFIKVVEGRNFLVAVRLFGTGIEFFDQTWKPDDVVRTDK